MAALNPDRPKLMRTWQSDKGDARTSTDNNDVAWLLFLHSASLLVILGTSFGNFPPFLVLPPSVRVGAEGISMELEGLTK